MEEITLESLSFGGDAVGKLHSGKVVFVPQGAPGDRARVRVIREGASYARADLVHVVTPGAARRTPPCELADRCGGCQWQHVRYEAQLAAKVDIVRRELRLDGELLEQVPAAAELGYRRRARFHWVRSRGSLVLGFMQRGSHQVLDVEQCPKLSPQLSAALPPLRRALARLSRGRGSVVAIAGHDGAVHLSLRLARSAGRSASARLAPALQTPPVAGGRIECRSTVEEFGADCVDCGAPGQPLMASAAAFLQANAAQDHRLAARVRSWVPGEARRILELFAGVGNLTRVLGSSGRAVTAVESSAAALRLLRCNCHGLPAKVTAEPSDAEQAAQRLAARGEGFDVVVMDPPRQGCSRPLLQAVIGLRPRWVLYVSCDPPTLGRDVALLREAGFSVVRGCVVDMMPQTYHVETIALLENSGEGSVGTC